MADTPVTTAQARLGQNLFAMLSALGDKPLEKARLGLDLSKTQYDISRQERLNKLKEPVLKAQSMAAQGQVEQSESPIHVSAFMTDMNALGHMLHQDPKGEEPLLIYKIANYFNADIDNKEGSPTRGQFLRRDTGNPVTFFDARKAAPKLKALILANTSTENRIQTEINRLKHRYKQGSIDRATYKAELQKFENFKKDPSAQLRVLEQQKSALGQFADTTNPILQSEITKGIDRIDRNIEERQDKIAEMDKEQRQFERQKQITQLQDSLGRKPKEGDVTKPFSEGVYPDIKTTQGVFRNGKWEWHDAEGLKKAELEAKSKSKTPDKDTITLPSGKLLSISATNTLFRNTYNIPDEFELEIMEASDDPDTIGRAKRYRELLTAKNFASFLGRLEREGMPQNWKNIEEETVQRFTYQDGKLVPK